MKCECLGMCLITTDCCWSLSTGNALWVILVALMTEPRWTGGSHWMEYFSCSQWNIFLVWFWEIIRAVIFALCPSRAQQIFDLPRCSETRNTWGNSNSFFCYAAAENCCIFISRIFFHHIRVLCQGHFVISIVPDEISLHIKRLPTQAWVSVTWL